MLVGFLIFLNIKVPIPPFFSSVHLGQSFTSSLLNCDSLGRLFASPGLLSSQEWAQAHSLLLEWNEILSTKPGTE